MYTLALVLFSIVAKHASGKKTGAPSTGVFNTCETMTPSHFSLNTVPLPIASQGFQSPYTFEAKWDKKSKLIRVSVNGATIAGFQIQGRLRKDGPAVGTFVNITQNPNARYQDCSADKVQTICDIKISGSIV